MSVTISLSGVDKIDKVLKGLPNVINHNMMSNVHVKAAQPLIQRMKLQAPLGETMNLTNSIGAVRESYGKSDTLGIVRVGARRGRFKGNHAHLVEYGTARRANKNGANRGVMPRKPFTYPSWVATRAQVERIISYEVSREVVGYIRRNMNG